jgi:DNA-binding GntR family transcriptional regulator
MSIVDALAADVRKNLFEGKLESNKQLTEAEIASKYGVARPTAKAAIEKLVTEGLLLRGTHKTARVPEMSMADVHDLYLTRVCIEVEVVRRLALAGQATKQAIAASVSALAADEVANSASPIIEPTVGFHLALVSALESPRLLRIYEGVMGEVRLCMAQMQSRKFLRRDAIVKEHKEILNRISAADAEGAAEAMRAHLTNAQERIARATA